MCVPSHYCRCTCNPLPKCIIMHYMCEPVCVCTHVLTCVCAHVLTCVCPRVLTCVCPRVLTCVCIYVLTCVFVYLCVYTHAGITSAYWVPWEVVFDPKAPPVENDHHLLPTCCMCMCVCLYLFPLPLVPPIHVTHCVPCRGADQLMMTTSNSWSTQASTGQCMTANT